MGVVTAKEKLRDIFAAGLIEGKEWEGAVQAKNAGHGLAFSSEKANQAKLETHGVEQVEQMVGRPTPPITA